MSSYCSALRTRFRRCRRRKGALPKTCRSSVPSVKTDCGNDPLRDAQLGSRWVGTSDVHRNHHVAAMHPSFDSILRRISRPFQHHRRSMRKHQAERGEAHMLSRETHLDNCSALRHVIRWPVAVAARHIRPTRRDSTKAPVAVPARWERLERHCWSCRSSRRIVS